MAPLDPDVVTRAAEALERAQVLVVTAGAGMGVDSGLPDFRGDQGFWKAYPMYERLGLSFVDAANPEHFERDPAARRLRPPAPLDPGARGGGLGGHLQRRRSVPAGRVPAGPRPRGARV